MLSAKLFDHTILKMDATEAEVKKICEEAGKYGFMSVCVNSCYAALVKRELAGTDVKLCVVVGFPLGQMSTRAKCAETEDAVLNGADEIDMVINVGFLKDRKDDLVREDIRAVREASRGKVLKVIIETCLLTKEEKQRACLIAKEAGADFVKTSTGFSKGGATEEDVRLMRQTVGKDMGVKASGGIHTREEAERLVENGAVRLGTSRTIDILMDKS